MSPLTAYHGQHPSRCFEAELAGVRVSAEKSGELEEALIDLKCKLLPAIYERPPMLRLEDRQPIESLTLTDHGLKTLEVRESLVWYAHGLVFEIGDPDLDYPIHEYVIILQVCVHAQDEPAHEHIDRSDQEEEEEEEEKDITQQDIMEALFLQRQPGVEGYFKRVGFLRARGHVSVRKFLEVHRSTESQVMTLV